MTVWCNGNNTYSSIRCTGNSNNLLRLELSASQCETKILVLQTKYEMVRNFTEIDVLEQVQLGIQDISQAFRHEFHIKSIWFADSDSNPVEIYRLLTRKILHAILNNQTKIIK